jgi:hypothetical protein
VLFGPPRAGGGVDLGLDLGPGQPDEATHRVAAGTGVGGVPIEAGYDRRQVVDRGQVVLGTRARLLDGPADNDAGEDLLAVRDRVVRLHGRGPQRVRLGKHHGPSVERLPASRRTPCASAEILKFGPHIADAIAAVTEEDNLDCKAVPPGKAAGG